MGFPHKRPWRQLTPHEREALSQRATSEVDRVHPGKKAQALFAGADGCSFPQAGRQGGMSQDGVSPLVERFPQRGLGALSIAPGRGRKPTVPGHDHEQILQEVQHRPPGEVDPWTVWSLSLVQRSWHATSFFDLSPRTIRRVLQAQGWTYQPTTHTWLPIDQGEESVPHSHSVAWVGRQWLWLLALHLPVDPRVPRIPRLSAVTYRIGLTVTSSQVISPARISRPTMTE